MASQPLPKAADFSAGIKIGEVARVSGLPVKTIRFYCDQDLITPLERTDSGYRVFDNRVFAELSLIRTLRSMEMPLSEIKKVIDVRRSGFCSCNNLKQSLSHKIKAIDQKIFDLQQMQQELSRLLQNWQDCGGVKAAEL